MEAEVFVEMWVLVKDEGMTESSREVRVTACVESMENADKHKKCNCWSGTTKVW